MSGTELTDGVDVAVVTSLTNDENSELDKGVDRDDDEHDDDDRDDEDDGLSTMHVTNTWQET